MKGGENGLIPAAELKVDIDRNAVKGFIEEELRKQINQQLLLVDINKLVELTCMSPRYLEDELLCDPRVRIYERRKQRKRWWIAQPTLKAIEEIVDNW